MRHTRTSRRARGFTLIEMLVAALVSVLLGAALWTLIRSSYDSQWEVQNQNMANLTARQQIDAFADSLRGSQGLTAAAASDVTFTDASGNAVRYWKSGSTLRKTVNSLPSGGTAVCSTVTALTFVYWTNNSGTWSSSSAPAAPANVGAVDFSVTISQNGMSRQISGSVRMRQK